MPCLILSASLKKKKKQVITLFSKSLFGSVVAVAF
jgi:hypothetical protein